MWLYFKKFINVDWSFGEIVVINLVRYWSFTGFIFYSSILVDIKK